MKSLALATSNGEVFLVMGVNAAKSRGVQPPSTHLVLLYNTKDVYKKELVRDYIFRCGFVLQITLGLNFRPSHIVRGRPLPGQLQW